MPRKKTTDEFIRDAVAIHGDNYEYSLVDYVGAKVKVAILCSTHGIFYQEPNNHLSGVGCPSCGKDHKRQTCIDRYGVENPNQNKQIREKSKATCLIRYGHENIAHGTLKEKVLQTNIMRYGVINPLSSSIIKDKAKQTKLERYGDEFFTNQTKRESTNLDRYGVNNPRKSESIKQQIKQTWLTKYNTPNHKQKHMVDIIPLIENYNWLFDQYIVQKKSAIQISGELGINDGTVGRYLRKMEISIRKENHSAISMLWLYSIEKSHNIHIQHNLNGGEYLIPGTRYKADGYCTETNTIYEFHGDYWHGNPKLYDPATIHPLIKRTMGELYQRTIDRENKIRSLGYNLVVMWESDCKINS